MAEMLDLSDQQNITVINMLRILTGNVYYMQEQMDNVGKGMEILRIKMKY